MTTTSPPLSAGLVGPPAPLDLAEAPPELGVVTEVVTTLGFVPVASLAVRIRRRRRPTAVLRVDLPESRDPEGPESLRLASVLTGLLSRMHGVSRLDLVEFADAPVSSVDAGVALPDDDEPQPNAAETGRTSGDEVGPATAHSPRPSRRPGSARSTAAARLAALAQRLDGAGFSIDLVLQVTGHSVARVTGAGRLAGPVDLGDLVSMAAPSRGESAGPLGAPRCQRDPHSGPFLELDRVPADLTAAAADALGYDPAGPLAADPDPIRAVQLWADALSATALPSELAALRLAWPLRHRAIRDIITMQCAWGPETGLVALEESLEPTALRPDAVFATFLGASPTAPDPQTLRRSVEVLRRVAECSPSAVAAAPLVMLAWLEWCRGRGTVAAAYLDECVRADPSCTLAHLFRQVLDQGWLPAWLD